jgi:hypothetical protein
LSNPEAVAAIVQEAAAKIVGGRRGVIKINNKEEATTDDGHPTTKFIQNTPTKSYMMHTFSYFSINTNKHKRRPTNIHYL